MSHISQNKWDMELQFTMDLGGETHRVFATARGETIFSFYDLMCVPTRVCGHMHPCIHVGAEGCLLSVPSQSPEARSLTEPALLAASKLPTILLSLPFTNGSG